MSEQPAAIDQLRLHAGGLPIGLQITGRRHDDLGVLQVAHACERMRPAQRPWPEPPTGAAADASTKLGYIAAPWPVPTRAATPVARAMRSARSAAEQRAVAPDDLLRHRPGRPGRGRRGRPGLAAAARDERRLPDQPDRAGHGARSRGTCSRRRAGRRRAARERGHFAAVQRWPTAAGRPPARLGRRCWRRTRATRSRCSGRSCGTSTAATPSACACARRARCPNGTHDDPLFPHVLACTPSAWRKGTCYPQAEETGRRALPPTRRRPGRCTPWRT